MISSRQIKELREKTGAGISDVKRALEESGGDEKGALEILKKKLGSVADKKMSRETRAGLVESYVHSNGRLGAIVEIFCETDFVAKNLLFKELAHNLAMHIAASKPVYLSWDNIPQEVLEAEKSRFEEEASLLNKPKRILEEIVDGKLKAHFGPLCLLFQPFIKEENKTVGDVFKEAVGKFGENVKIGRFARFEI